MGYIISGVLFDLDGTLLDTALDLADATNHVIKEFGATTQISDEEAREVASDGMRALMKRAIPESEHYKYDFDKMREPFIKYYNEHINDRTKFFPGVEELLEELKADNVPFGIVTSKPHDLTLKLISKFDILKDLKGVAGCDIIPFSKPSPEPIFYVCKILGISPQEVLYVGDHKRDIEAAKNAQSLSGFAKWGYIKKNEDIESYGANFYIDEPKEIIGIRGCYHKGRWY
ncbi:MAG: HAD-IA family hydrolase [Succinivibrionaceae bacterium]|nr:HAD-IA family hydrolase [Ruminobacter sp.]MDY5780039.1 HAD-IA family hydrolase [Succinivibrionaceae bacterium]MEE1340767.1 HAD-IA family hydrolase [Succinivibrionaceae bacterium]